MFITLNAAAAKGGVNFTYLYTAGQLVITPHGSIKFYLIFTYNNNNNNNIFVDYILFKYFESAK